MKVVVAGGGVVGTTLAFMLARRGAEVVLVERAAVACAASGKSGGFLALDWCDGTPLETLARRSFALHATLAAEASHPWGYRRMATYAGQGSARRPARSPRRGGPAWVGPALTVTGQLGAPETTAQVVPAAFTSAMMQAAEACGATLRIGEARGLARRGDTVVGLELEDSVVEGDAVVIAMGPWSLLAAGWLPLPPVYGLKGHSLVFETGDRLPPEALFLDWEEADGTRLSPEVFPRDDGSTYVCAISTEPSLPLDPRHVKPDAGAIERLRAVCAAVSPTLAEAPVRASGACFRPVTTDGLPYIGAVSGAPGAYVATGHSVWGILNAPATAEALTEIILDGSTRTVDLEPFSPARHQAFDSKRLQVAST